MVPLLNGEKKGCKNTDTEPCVESTTTIFLSKNKINILPSHQGLANKTHPVETELLYHLDDTS